ncbi:OmpA family protein [Cytophagales bacterium LB-30]|uniref:OmpA family protein n=1 Tax=Shiella aurantiaca TaxID=3058365 RepID=A0ABT8F651_9BACT|nr:OmpA family protein [Shiella aurantiaca]MDN4165942.1 OmpA family protein [Shiella aurantiaca]
MNRFLPLFFTIILFFISSAHAQKISAKAEKLYNEAGALINQRKFFEAEKVLKEALEKQPDFWEANMRLASLYKMLLDNEKAILYFEKAVAIQPTDTRNDVAYFTLANWYFSQGEYEKAQTHLSVLLNFPITKKQLLEDAEFLQACVAFAIQAKNQPATVEIKPLNDPLNQWQLQYFPVITADMHSLIFTARYTSDRNSDENIFITNKTPEGWSAPQPISKAINTPYNEGTCTISADGRTLIITSCAGRQSVGGCDLYISYKEGEEWSEPKNLGPNVNTRSWESQPSLSADGRVLFWASDRPGGKGKTDIWMSTRNAQGEWTLAKNAGPSINTTRDELSPYFHFDQKTLFFSSNGYIGMGGYDVFYSQILENGQFGAPKNLGYPLNDHNDQMGFIFATDGKKAYFSDDQKRNGVPFSYLKEAAFAEPIVPLNDVRVVQGIVTDEQSGNYLGAKVELYDLKTDSILFQTFADRVNGRYLITLAARQSFGLYVEHPGYMPQSRTMEIVGDERTVQENFTLSPLEKGKSIQLHNIYFASNEFALLPESYSELQRMFDWLQANPSIAIEIIGHTDDVGEKPYNQDLSEKRAQSVYQYLFNLGIEKARMRPSGLGESFPLKPNDSSANRAFNRRIEFLIK